MKTNNKIQKFPINWTDGVKLNMNHFKNQYFSIVETIKNYNASNHKAYDYGILSAFDSNVGALELEVTNDSGNTVSITLKSCNAIAKNGYKIVFYEDLYGADFTPRAILDLNKTDLNLVNEFSILLSINPFDLVPVGYPDPEVIPLHYPNVLPKLNLEIIPANQINTHFIEGNFLIIGQIICENGVFSVNSNYIPPVKKICYNENIEHFRKELIQLLIRMRKNSIQIIKKNRHNNRTNCLADNTFTFCNDVNKFYTESIFYFEQVIAEKSPIFLVNKISVLANQLSISMSLMGEKEREELLQYYYEWTDVKPSNFIATIESVLNIQYNHLDIALSINKLKDFVYLLDKLFNKMSDLEYIGQRKDNIVVNEDLDIKKEKKESSGSWSIFD